MPSLPFSLPAPFDTAVADAYTRMMLRLLPPGRLWRWVNSLLVPFFEAAALELERLHARVADAIREANPATAVETLSEREADLDLPSTGSDAERQARVVARFIARQRYRPVDFQQALALILGQDAADVAVLETTHAMASAMGDDREIFRFFVYRDPEISTPYNIDDAQALIDNIKPEHTEGFAIESINFCCDDQYSLCDRDLVGA